MRKFREKIGNYAKIENLAKNTEFLKNECKILAKSCENSLKKNKFWEYKTHF